jgi:hypothetical protein
VVLNDFFQQKKKKKKKLEIANCLRFVTIRPARQCDAASRRPFATMNDARSVRRNIQTIHPKTNIKQTDEPHNSQTQKRTSVMAAAAGG